LTHSSPNKVLIAEDEPLVLALAQEEFEDAGFEVVAAPDGQAALAALAEFPDISLLFTDIRMPGDIDGWALAKAARQMKPDLPVIYATGFSHGEPDIVDGGLLFTKPYRLTSILNAARSLRP